MMASALRASATRIHAISGGMPATSGRGASLHQRIPLRARRRSHFADDGSRASGDGLRHKAVAVGFFPANSDKQAPGGRLGTLVNDRSYFGVRMGPGSERPRPR